MKTFVENGQTYSSQDFFAHNVPRSQAEIAARTVQLNRNSPAGVTRFIKVDDKQQRRFLCDMVTKAPRDDALSFGRSESHCKGVMYELASQEDPMRIPCLVDPKTGEYAPNELIHPASPYVQTFDEGRGSTGIGEGFDEALAKAKRVRDKTELVNDAWCLHFDRLESESARDSNYHANHGNLASHVYYSNRVEMGDDAGHTMRMSYCRYEQGDMVGLTGAVMTVFDPKAPSRQVKFPDVLTTQSDIPFKVESRKGHEDIVWFKGQDAQQMEHVLIQTGRKFCRDMQAHPERLNELVAQAPQTRFMRQMPSALSSIEANQQASIALGE